MTIDFNRTLSFTHFIIALLCCLMVSVNVFSQQTESEILASKALLKAVNEYDRYFGKNLSVYTGSEYPYNYAQVGDHQFFFDDYWEQGNVAYNGERYDSIFMKFDIYNDIVVVEYFSDRGLTMPLQLESAKVSAFELHGHTFVRMVADTTSILKTGFYDQLFLGTHISAYSQRKKEIVRTTGSNTLKDDFVEKDRYYLLKDGIYYPVKKRSSVIRVLEDRKKEVRQFIKMNTLLFSTERDRDLQIVTRYYESLFTQ